MSSGMRVFIASCVVILGLIAVTFFIKPAKPDSAPPSAISILSENKPVATAPPATLKHVPPAPASAAGAASPAPVAEAEPEPAEEQPDPVACEACRKTSCSNYQGSGVNLMDGCFAQINTEQGADATDRRFLEDCQAAVACAHEHKCVSGPFGAASCYCGSNKIEDCLERGPAADAPCTEQWKRATRSNDVREVAKRFSDLKYPAGWANFLLECDVNDCKGKCAT